MKLVTPAAERPKFWLYQHDLTCPDCGIAFRVQPGDQFLRGPYDPAAALDCPYCRLPLLAFPGAGDAPPAVKRAHL